MTKAQQLGITEFPYREYDENGNNVYFEYSDGWWVKREYDSKGNITYYENLDGWWQKSEYNDKGREVYYENSEGKIIDNRPKTMTKAQKKGIKKFPYREYDAQGNEIYWEDSYGNWEKKQFNSNNKLTFVTNSDDEWVKLYYNENGSIVKREYSDGYITNFEYDEKGREKKGWDSSGACWEKTYDENGEYEFKEWVDINLRLKTKLKSIEKYSMKFIDDSHPEHEIELYNNRVKDILEELYIYITGQEL